MVPLPRRHELVPARFDSIALAQESLSQPIGKDDSTIVLQEDKSGVQLVERFFGLALMRLAGADVPVDAERVRQVRHEPAYHSEL
jgi:hypothetical protein